MNIGKPNHIEFCLYYKQDKTVIPVGLAGYTCEYEVCDGDNITSSDDDPLVCADQCDQNPSCSTLQISRRQAENICVLTR